MNSHTWRSFLFFLVLLGRLSAGEWSHWAGVGGDLASDRSASVVIRSRHDEGGDQPDLGYRFVYELHNQSGTQPAKVILYCPVQDPATRRWKEVDRNTPTIVHDLPPQGTVTGSRYSPAERGFTFESDVKWPEEQAGGEKGPQVDGEQAPSALGVAGPGPKTAEAQTEFEGVPLSDRAAVEKVVRQYMDSDDDFTYQATLVFQIPPGRTEWVGVEDDVEVDMSGTWRERMEYWLAYAERPLAVDGRDLSYQAKVISVTSSEMVVEFDRMPKDQMVRYLTTDAGWAANHHTVIRKMAKVTKR
jgi:hypothetical protein